MPRDIVSNPMMPAMNRFIPLKKLPEAIGYACAGILVFLLSVYLFPFVALAAVIGLLATIAGEACHVLPRKSWLRFTCWAWLVLMIPTFGIMPLLMAPRLLREFPLGNSLGISTGITLSGAYDLFVPTPELFAWDHPFPPLTNAHLYAMGFATLILSLLPVYCLIRIQSARVVRDTPR